MGISGLVDDEADIFRAGSAFTLEEDNFQSNILLISEGGEKLLIDCGSDIRFSLNAAGLSYLDITNIYISHLHADHVGGLEYIGFSTKFNPKCSRPKLYLNEDLARELWEKTLSGGMSAIQGEIAELNTYFDVQKIPKNDFFVWEGIKFSIVPTVHIITMYLIVLSYGLFFEVDGVKVFLTTDSQFCVDKIGDFYNKADIIFQDCETSSFKSRVHAHYEELLTLPEEVRKKMWLYHYQPGTLPNAKKDGFRGFVKRGQVFEASSFYL